MFGDWGATDSTGANPDQANLDAQIAASGATFAVSTGDTGYQGGSQTNYGDLYQTGPEISGVFAPAFYKDIGDGIPMFAAPGNHGLNATFLNIWPQPTAPMLSGGVSRYDAYNVPGTNPANYPSVWYAFTVGQARFYILTAAWANSNIGDGDALLRRLQRPLDHVVSRVPVARERPRDAPDADQVRGLPLPDVLRQQHGDHGHVPARPA